MGLVPTALKKRKLKKKTLTADTIEEHREVILAQGKKYKTPMNEMQKKVVIFAGILAGAVILISALIGWLSLYVFQSTGDIAFRVTRVLPLPVASVEGQRVRYGDYLLVYRSSIAPIERQNGKLEQQEGGEWLVQHYKRAAMDTVLKNGFAKRLAKEYDVEVSAVLLEQTIREYRVIGESEWSEASFLRAIQENFGLSRREYEDLVRISLLIREVTVRVDTEALDTIIEVEGLIGSKKSFEEISKSMERVEIGASDGMVDAMTLDGGRAKMALTLEIGQVSEKFVSRNGDGYYIVKTVKKNDGKVEYQSLFVRFTEFERRFNEMRASGGIREFIRLSTAEE